MSWIVNAIDGTEVNEKPGLAHPIHELIRFLDQADPATVVHTYRQKEDGSKEITFTLPSRSDLAKQKAMQQVQQAEQQATAPNVSQMPAGGSASMGQEQAVAAGRAKVSIKVSSSKDALSQFPKVFIRAMGFDSEANS